MAEEDDSGTVNFPENPVEAPGAPTDGGQTTPNVTVNVGAPASTGPTEVTQPMIDSFLGRRTAATPSGGLAGAAPAPSTGGEGFFTGFKRGAETQIYGVLSLLPGIGHYFTRESRLGQEAYAPVHGAGATIGHALGTATPWLVGGEALGGARAVSALSRLSPSLSRVLTGAARARPVTTEAGTAGGGIVRFKPTVARGAAIGLVAGAAQEPEGDPSLQARVAPAVAGALTAGALTKIGLTTAQISGVQRLIGTLGAISGYELGGGAGLGMTVAAMYGLHHLKLGVREAGHLAPLIAAEARRMARAGATSTAAAAGATAGKIANDIGQIQ